jgi:hypothetical protein
MDKAVSSDLGFRTSRLGSEEGLDVALRLARRWTRARVFMVQGVS